MSATIRVPAQTRDVADTESVPFKRAYDRAKEFLKRLLRNDTEWADRSPENRKTAHRLIQENQTVDLIKEFRQQLLAYARKDYPFADQLIDGDTLHWWETLEYHPRARVLAVSASVLDDFDGNRWRQMLAVKIYSTLVNSMPDERTGSRITWFNSPLRGNQDVSTLVNMIQVGQWYGVHKASYCCHIGTVCVLICGFQADIKKERRRPTVKFRDMIKELEKSARASAGSISEPGQDETPSDEEMEDDNAFGATHSLPEADAFAVDTDVDLDSRFLLDMLSIDGPRQLEVSNTGLEGTGATSREGDKVPNWDF